MKTATYQKSIPTIFMCLILLNTFSVFAYTLEKNQVIDDDTFVYTIEEKQELLSVDINGPYVGIVGIPLTMTASASGGNHPYSWIWQFGDNTSSNYQNPTHVYTSPGIYLLTVQVTDAEATIVEKTTTATITITEDTTPPSLSLLTPQTGFYFYTKLLKIMSVQTTIIIGGIDVHVSATDEESGIKEVRFYIDGELKQTINTTPYIWTWNEKTILGHILKVEAIDNAGNTKSISQPIIIFNLNPNFQYGLISGSVFGPYGKMGASGVNVTVTNGTYSKSVQTGRIPFINRGDFRMRLPVGDYYLEITKSGFKTQGKNITVRLSENEKIIFVLERE